MSRASLIVGVGMLALLLACHTAAGDIFAQASLISPSAGVKNAASATKSTPAPTDTVAWRYFRKSSQVAASESDAPSAERRFYFSAGQDPLYRSPERPGYGESPIDKPEWERPAWDRPSYTVPEYGLPGIERPAIERPFYLAPNDDKPNNYIAPYVKPANVPPAVIKPVVIGPNVVVPNDVAPPENRPTYDRPLWTPPEAVAPNIQTEEYSPQRYEPAPYLGPPR